MKENIKYKIIYRDTEKNAVCRRAPPQTTKFTTNQPTPTTRYTPNFLIYLNSVHIAHGMQASRLRANACHEPPQPARRSEEVWGRLLLALAPGPGPGGGRCKKCKS
jgi:hypothetical protein